MTQRISCYSKLRVIICCTCRYNFWKRKMVINLLWKIFYSFAPWQCGMHVLINIVFNRRPNILVTNGVWYYSHIHNANLYGCKVSSRLGQLTWTLLMTLPHCHPLWASVTQSGSIQQTPNELGQPNKSSLLLIHAHNYFRKHLKSTPRSI